ncbi:Proliferation-associated protein 2G4 [Coemansia sp. RSA 564]|nr:Proliferation-associated protein 2G4 [Coemansia sp. RSA 564]KAJ2173750.1 Proliferation-associated protein 2G4 [Coemansia sp. RSA 560]KAJ2287381.1 Proliferation-associated protein 2G4 [Coemansia sp. RSA 355]KAJ2404941.1 Proliferation-associated protein 2G4 [Coemansia sp. RSA 2526]KAJ2840139.1 Proliferation-associated protein 2G4 [Coemansia erecta]
MDIQNSDNKYRTSAAIVDQVLKQASVVVVPGMSVAAICSYADELVEASCRAVFRKEETIERGVALPTTVSVNRIIQNYSPGPEGDYVLREGDVAKVEVSAHIDGCMASAAHTSVATNAPGTAITDRRADVISAAYHASEVAARMIRPGQSARNVVKALGLVAAGFNCTVAADTFTCQIDRFVISGKNTFANRFDPDALVDDFTFESGETYTVDCTLSSGSGISRQSAYESTVYQRDVNRQHSLKLRTSRALFSEVSRRFSVFPFLMRAAVGDSSALKAGITECVRARLLAPFAVTMDKEPGETFVAQFKSTVRCHYTGPVRLTRALPLPNVQSSVVIPAESEIGQILALDCEQATLPELPRLKLQIQTPVPVKAGSTESGAAAAAAMDMS